MIKRITKRSFFGVLMIATCFFFTTVTNSLERVDQDLKIHPTADKKSPTKVYIPKDLDDCFLELKKMLDSSLIQEMKSNDEKSMVRYHFGLGMWLRNNWGLWGGSRLAKYFNSIGIKHPDDMSGIIFTSFWRRLNEKPINLNAQLE